MNALECFRRGAENNLWSNFRLHRACAKLEPGEYERARTSFFPSLKKTLEHIYLVDAYYLDALERGGNGRATYSAPDPTFERLQLLVEAQRAVDRKLLAFVSSLTDDRDLDAIVAVQRPARDYEERIGDVLQHMFVHQIHHRGQAHAMLSGTSVPPPQLDELYLREDLPRRESDLLELGLPVR